MKLLQEENKYSPQGWHLVHATWQFLNGVFDFAAPVMSEYGLHQKSLVLLALLDKGDTPQSLARLLHSPPSTISHMLRELEDKGLITRRLDDKDRRKFRLRRTDSGEKALQAGIDAINEAVDRQFSTVPSAQRELLAEALPLLLHLVEPTETKESETVVAS